MHRLLVLVLLIFSAGLGRSGVAQTSTVNGLPPRPAPFRFVNDQAQLLAPADAKKLESGLRRYADNTGTQVVVVTVPSLGGRDVADYGRALGTAWGVGQRDKNNGLVVLLSAKEHKVTIQPGSGLKSTITPAVVNRIISEMTPRFKQGNYFAGLRSGLNTLMVTANPSSAPHKNQPGTAVNPAAAEGAASRGGTAPATQSNLSEEARTPAVSNDPIMARPTAEPVSSGPGFGTLLIGALVIGGGLWFLLRLFRNRNSANAPVNMPANGTPNFLPNRPNGPAPTGGFGQAPGNYGPGYGAAPSSGGGMGGMGMGGILATGAAAAAGAYLGNRMASDHDTSGSNLTNEDGNQRLGAGAAGAGAAGAGAAGAGAAGAGAAGTDAAGDYFSSRDAGAADNSAPDYFSDDSTAADNSSSDYFSSDDSNSSYDDTSSTDTGGGGFDDDSNDSGGSGSW